MSVLLFGTVNKDIVIDEQERREAQARVDRAGHNTVDYLVYLQRQREIANSAIDEEVDPRAF